MLIKSNGLENEKKGLDIIIKLNLEEISMIIMIIIIYVRRIVSKTYCFITSLKIWKYVKLENYI